MNVQNKCVSFLNPALPSPWSVSPTGYFVPKRHPVVFITKKASFVSSGSRSTYKYRNRVCKKKKPSAQEITVRKLAEYYPELSKRKISAALIICDNNLLQAVGLLELKRVNFERYNLQASSILPPKKRKFVRLSSQISLGVLPPLGSFPKEIGVAPVPSISPICTNSVTENSSISTVNCSDVYEFSETDSVEHYEMQRPLRKPVNKVGVVLKKGKRGSYTVTLM